MGGKAWGAYAWEQETWPEYRKIIVTRHEQEVYVRKLVRHFKTPPVEVRQSYRRGGAGCYFPKRMNVFTGDRSAKLIGGVIKMGKETNLGTVIHEFAHHLEYHQYGSGGHRKTFKRCLKRVYRWAKRWLPKEAANEVGLHRAAVGHVEAEVLVNV